jgi:hypothetical protein
LYEVKKSRHGGLARIIRETCGLAKYHLVIWPILVI